MSSAGPASVLGKVLEARVRRGTCLGSGPPGPASCRRQTLHLRFPTRWVGVVHAWFLSSSVVVVASPEGRSASVRPPFGLVRTPRTSASRKSPLFPAYPPAALLRLVRAGVWRWRRCCWLVAPTPTLLRRLAPARWSPRAHTAAWRSSSCCWPTGRTSMQPPTQASMPLRQLLDASTPPWPGCCCPTAHGARPQCHAVSRALVDRVKADTAAPGGAQQCADGRSFDTMRSEATVRLPPLPWDLSRLGLRSAGINQRSLERATSFMSVWPTGSW